MAKTGAFFFFTFGILALAATFAQINPVWLYGPYNPVAMSAGSQPDFYMGMLEGALRVFPAWQWVVFGHTFAFNVFIPALVPLGLIFTGAAVWPFIEQWVTGDKREHHLNDRPRNAPTRTAIGIAVITFYGILWAEGANDVIAEHFDVSLYLTTEIARVAWFVGPILAYIITKRICLGLQMKDVHLLEHGVETGIIRQTPVGEFIEETRPVSEEARAVLESRPTYPPLPPADGDEEGVPAPGMRGAIGKVRARLYNVATESVPLPANGHGDGHGNGHAVAANGHGEPAAVPAGGSGQADSGESGDEPPAGSDGH
jgi:ubiquinol-cytochrome c reductase cytochrome b subunit